VHSDDSSDDDDDDDDDDIRRFISFSAISSSKRPLDPES
jgi:hypothetical protein